MAVVDLSGPVKLNLSAIDDSPIAAGEYDVKIITAEAKLSKKGQPQINVMARVTDEASSEYNKAVFWYLTFDENPESFPVKMLKRCVAAIPAINPDLDYPSYQAFGNDLIGKELRVEIKHGEYEGEVSVQVKKFMVMEYEDL